MLALVFVALKMGMSVVGIGERLTAPSVDPNSIHPARIFTRSESLTCKFIIHSGFIGPYQVN